MNRTRATTLITGLALTALAGVTVPTITTAPASAASCSTIHVGLLNGSQAVGFTSNTTGAQLINVAKPGRAFSLCLTGSTYRGLSLATVQTSTGLYVASNTSCTGLVLKQSATQDGTAVAFRTPGGGSTEFVVRFCDTQNRGSQFAVYASDNHAGDQWFVCNGPNGPDCATAGAFHALDLA